MVLRPDISTDSIVELHNAGWTIRQISKKLNMSYTGVYGRLIHAGVDMRHRGYRMSKELKQSA